MKTILTAWRPIALGLILILAANTANAMVTDTEEATSPSKPVTKPSKQVVDKSSSNLSQETKSGPSAAAVAKHPISAERVLRTLQSEASLFYLKKSFEDQVHTLLRSPQASDACQQIELCILRTLQYQITSTIRNSGLSLSKDDASEIRGAVAYQSSFELVELAKNEDLRRAHIRVDILDLLKSESLHDYFLVDWYLKNIPDNVTELDLSVLLVINPLEEPKRSTIKNLLRLPPLNKFTALKQLTLQLPPLPLECQLSREQVSGLDSIVTPLATLENYEALLDLPKLEKLFLTQSRRVVFYGVKESSMTPLSTDRDELKQIMDPHNILPALLGRNVSIVWKVSFIGKGQRE